VTVRLSAIFSEAFRNLTTGTSRALLLAVALTAAVAVTVGVDVRAVVTEQVRHEEFRMSGAATWVLTDPGNVDAGRCERLTAIAGVGAAGALRQAGSTTLAVLPSTSVPMHEATAGMVRVLRVKGTAAAGTWLPQTYAEDTGLAVGATTPTVGGAPLTVAGLYPFPDAARSNPLSHAVLAPAPPTGAFDQCWVDLTVYDEATLALLSTALRGPGDSAQPAQVTQLNTSLGRSHDLPTALAERSTRPLSFAAPVLSALLAVIAVRMRRLELASARHIGVRRRDLTAQVTIEAALWAGAGAVLSLAAIYLLAAMTATGRDLVTISPHAAWLWGARITVCAWATTVLATAGTVATVRARTLFRYFRER
jgi:hypothetical protein